MELEEKFILLKKFEIRAHKGSSKYSEKIMHDVRRILHQQNRVFQFRFPLNSLKGAV